MTGSIQSTDGKKLCSPAAQRLAKAADYTVEQLKHCISSVVISWLQFAKFVIAAKIDKKNFFL
jgi:hypothetical protein